MFGTAGMRPGQHAKESSTRPSRGSDMNIMFGTAGMKPGELANSNGAYRDPYEPPKGDMSVVPESYRPKTKKTKTSAPAKTAPPPQARTTASSSIPQNMGKRFNSLGVDTSAFNKK